MEPKRLISERTAGFQNVHAQIYGFQQCCSAAILHGVQGYSVLAEFPKEAPLSLRTMSPEPVTSFEDWVKGRSSKSKMFVLPRDYAMCVVLEKLYQKAAYGIGGNNMYASPRYATKTWFMADRRRNPSSMSCMSFMLWLKEQGPGKVGRIHISPYRPGAHGGECKGGVYAPDCRKIETFLNEKLEDLNRHAAWVFEHYKLDPSEMGENYEGDEVGQLW